MASVWMTPDRIVLGGIDITASRIGGLVDGGAEEFGDADANAARQR
jgi:hypothetical protein